MKKWEYKTVKVPTTGFMGGTLDCAELSEKLNFLGEEGWEVITSLVTNQGNGYSKEVVVILKREKSA